MKYKLLILFLFPAFLMEAQSNMESIPKKIINKFNSLYPNASVTKWEIDTVPELKIDSNTIYFEVHFIKNNFTSDAMFQADGSLVDISTKWPDTILHPKAVVNKFKVLYPIVTNIDWYDNETDTSTVDFMVHFWMNHFQYEVTFYIDGALESESTYMPDSLFPEKVINTLKKKKEYYPEAKYWRKKSKGVITYMVGTRRRGKEYTMFIDNNGKIIKYVKDTGMHSIVTPAF